MSIRTARAGAAFWLSLAIGLAGCTSAGTSADLGPSSPGASSTPAPTSSPSTLVEMVRASRPSLTFTPLAPSYLPDAFEAAVSTRRGARGPVSGGETLLLEIELRSVATPWRPEVRILQGPAGCCLDSARPMATPNVDIHESTRGQLIPLQDYGGPIVWWVEQGTYVAVSSPWVTTIELLRIARSMTPVR